MSDFEPYYRIGKSRGTFSLKSLFQFRSNGKIRWGKIFLALFTAGTLSLLGFILLVYAGAFGRIPDVASLKKIQQAVASEIYDAEGELIGTYYTENRTQAVYAQFPPHLVDALVATEDARFFEHAGIDYRSLGRVLFKSILLADESSGGGSTLTQQLAKNLFPRENFSILSLPVAKVKEMILAKRLESAYSSKEIILTLYLNTVPFGEDVYGIAAASRRFFNLKPQELSPEQSALLVGMLKATSTYNPRLHPERAVERRNVVFDQMVKYERLEAGTADSLKALPINLNYRHITPSTGLAPHFRQEVADYLKDWLSKYNQANGTDYNLYTDGLKIHTTLDANMQSYAEEAVRAHMQTLQKEFDKHWSKRTLWKVTDPGFVRALHQSRRYKSLKAQGLDDKAILDAMSVKHSIRVWTYDGYERKEMSSVDSIQYYLSYLQAGLMAMEPRSGHVKAWVGGIDYRAFQYDHVTAQRQVGSTFKPIIYASALDAGMDPCAYISAEKQTYPNYKNWSPGNADGKYEGFYTLRGGLVNSVNTVSAALIMEVGVEEASIFAERFGFQARIPHEPSLVLGTADLSVREMVGAYSAFANKGVRSKPVFITRIENAAGETLANWPESPQNVPVLDPTQNAMMVDMLKDVVNQGTARRLRSTYGLQTDIAGKTGTTQNHTDGWFMGVTPELVVGVWVGGDDRQVRFRSLSLGQGAHMALPIYGKFMKKVYSDRAYRKIRNARFPDVPLSALESMDCPMYSEFGYNPENQWDLNILLDNLRRQAEERKLRRQERREERRRDKEEEGGDRWDGLFKRKNQRDQ